MDMYIEIPSGKIFLNGRQVQSLKRKPYIVIDGVKSPLSEAKKSLAREMWKAFGPLIERESEVQHDSRIAFETR